MEKVDLKIAPRRFWLAAPMSYAAPGLGQLYNGNPKRALFFGVIQVIVVPPLMASFILLPRGWLVPAILVTVSLYIILVFWSVIDAGISAKRAKTYLLARYNRWYLYLAFILGSILVLPITVGTIRSDLYEPYVIPATSMAPTVLAGDRIYADKRWDCYSCDKKIVRGQLILFRTPFDHNRIYIKRVIGMPGDLVQSVDGKLIVNGKTYSQTREGKSETHYANGYSTEGERYTESDGIHTYSILLNPKSRKKGNVPDVTVTVPDGNYFVLGDNRDVSFDSRFWGNVPVSNVIGYPKQIWFSKEPDGRFRWERIFQVLE